MPTNQLILVHLFDLERIELLGLKIIDMLLQGK